MIMSIDRFRTSPCLELPNLHRLVIRDGYHILAIGMEDDTSYPVVMTRL